MNTAILVVAIGLWGASHSWLASWGAKGVISGKLGPALGRTYRLAYNGFAVLSFLPILALMLILPDRVLYLVAAPWRYLMVAVEVSALVLLILTLLATDTMQFVGLRQIFDGERPSSLVTGGFYRWVRHPLYLFGLVIMWFTPLMTLNSLVVVIALTIYLVIGARFEERKLLREFGAEYGEYRARTPMLIPGWGYWKRPVASGKPARPEP